MGLREDIKTSKMHFRRGNSKTVYFITMHRKQTILETRNSNISPINYLDNLDKKAYKFYLLNLSNQSSFFVDDGVRTHIQGLWTVRGCQFHEHFTSSFLI